MLSEDQFLIIPVECWITRNGNGVVEDRHVKSEEDHKYYRIQRRETRYRIIRASGVPIYLPSLTYETPLMGEAYFASGVVRKTRRYIRELDKSWFKFYDDADEVRQNIIKFILWLKNPPKISKTQMKKIMSLCGYLIQDVHPTQEWVRLSKIEFDLKKRKDLSPLKRELQDELDLFPENN